MKTTIPNAMLRYSNGVMMDQQSGRLAVVFYGGFDEWTELTYYDENPKHTSVIQIDTKYLLQALGKETPLHVSER